MLTFREFLLSQIKTTKDITEADEISKKSKSSDKKTKKQITEDQTK